MQTYFIYLLLILFAVDIVVSNGFLVSRVTSKIMTVTKTKTALQKLHALPAEVEHLLNSNPSLRDFDRKVYEFCSRVPAGSVTTYKELAKAIGSPTAFRAVGSALRKNPFAPTVPCHRVVATDRSLGGFYGSKDMAGPLMQKKIQMLKDEGITFDGAETKKIKVAQSCIYQFP